jgi:uncharacterized damage-inducible protein DinB
MTIYGAKELANSFQTVRKNTIPIAEEIPESQYGFVAAEGVRSVAELLAHIALAPRIWIDINGADRVSDMGRIDFMSILRRQREAEQQPRTKAQLLDLLKTEGEKCQTFLNSLSDSLLAESVVMPGQADRTRLEGLMGLKEHEMHHRGQLMLIERMLGMVPHLTRQFNERVRQMEQAQAAAQTA